MKTKHTPLPWHVFSNYKGGIPLSVGSLHSPRGSVTIARIDWLGSNSKELDDSTGIIKADAEFIVRACNTHYDLVNACKEAVKALTSNCAWLPDEYQTAFRECEAAIKKAEGEE